MIWNVPQLLEEADHKVVRVAQFRAATDIRKPDQNYSVVVVSDADWGSFCVTYWTRIQFGLVVRRAPGLIRGGFFTNFCVCVRVWGL